MSHFSVPRVECVTLVSSEFSMQNDVFRRSHAVARLWLWIAVVDVVCVMFGLGLTVCGAVIRTKLSTPYLVLFVWHMRQPSWWCGKT
jgi:hypothetical protein